MALSHSSRVRLTLLGVFLIIALIGVGFYVYKKAGTSADVTVSQTTDTTGCKYNRLSPAVWYKTDCTSVTSTGDTDGDGVGGDATGSPDKCPNTVAGDAVDANGCSAAQRAAMDSDGDGVPNSTDKCPGTPAGEAVDADGCSASQRAGAGADTDGDGVGGDATGSPDKCPNTPKGETVDINGCSASQRKPVAPTDLKAASATDTSITLTWTDTANEEGYAIDQGDANCTNFKEIAKVAANTTSYTVKNLTPGTTYCFRIRAYSVDGESASNNIVASTTGGSASTTTKSTGTTTSTTTIPSSVPTTGGGGSYFAHLLNLPLDLLVDGYTALFSNQ